MTNHFTFFKSYYEAIKDLDAEIKSEYFDILFNYALYDIEPGDDASPIPKALFNMAKPNLDTSKAKREAGKQGGSKKKQTTSKPKANTKQTSTDKEKEIGVRSRSKEVRAYEIPGTINLKAWGQWEKHRRQIKKKLTALSAQKQINLLVKHIDDHEAIIEQSIQNGWTGLFELKGDKPPRVQRAAPQPGSIAYNMQHQDDIVVEAE